MTNPSKGSLAMSALSLLLLCSLLVLPLASSISCRLFAEEEQTWTNFVDYVHESWGWTSICSPFLLQGDACNGNGKGFEVDSDLYLTCDNSLFPDSICEIKCSGRHFTVNAGAKMEVDRFTLSDATRSSLRVNPGGILVATSEKFLNNKNLDGEGGGAINAEAKSDVKILWTDFDHNTAALGGAVYGLGTIFIKESEFTNNNADSNLSPVGISFGGAICAQGKNSDLSLVGNDFNGNSASFMAPAVYASNDYSATDNSGCHNEYQDGLICDGVQVPVGQVMKCDQGNFSSSCGGNRRNRHLLRHQKQHEPKHQLWNSLFPWF